MPTTPRITESHPPSGHTPSRAGLIAAANFMDKHHVRYKRLDLYAHFHIPPRTGSRVLRTAARRVQNDNTRQETRGRKHLISKEKLQEIDTFIEQAGWDGRTLTWEQVGESCGLEASARTIQRSLGTLGYHKCIACRKGYVNKATAEQRLKFATEMLRKYPEKEDWRRVRFSGEVHFGFGPQGKAQIIRQPGQRYCADCIEERNIPNEKDEKRLHAWAAIGYGFKSPLLFYDNPKNRNGKLSHQVYIDQILNIEVKRWIDEGHDFVLEEDGDSGHGPSSNNIVRTWKEDHGIEYYYNVHSSPDLAPIENSWSVPKHQVSVIPHWDDKTTRALALQGWDDLKQESIDRWCDSMPKRLQDVIDAEGRMTAN